RELCRPADADGMTATFVSHDPPGLSFGREDPSMHRAVPAAAAALLATTPAAARITAFEVTAQESFADGQDFGAGPYLRVSGIARRELDPADPRHATTGARRLRP